VRPGQIVILNGAPRSGKSSIVAALQERPGEVWMNLGVDVARSTTPPALQPGIGLRPGEPQHAAAERLPALYAALYESVAAHSRLGLAVAVDVGHHDRAILADVSRRLAGLPVLFVGVRCPIEVVMERRRAAETYVSAAEGEAVPEPVLRWQEQVHGGWEYDLELDTSQLSPQQCAAVIAGRLASGLAASALARLAPPAGPTLSGERVVLRPVRLEDEAPLRTILAEPAVAQWWPDQAPPWPFEDDPGSVKLAILVEGQVAGFIQFHEHDDPDFPSASIDLFLSTAHHGRGLGTEAVRVVVRHLIDERGHHRITIDPAAANAAAIRSYEKAGFQRVGVLRAYQRDHRHGGWMDGLLLDLVEPG
jgi:chloramphenicol 3-O phosphotransferase